MKAVRRKLLGRDVAADVAGLCGFRQQILDQFPQVPLRAGDVRDLRPELRKLALTAHVVSSVGWLGSVAAFLALSLIGVTSDDAQTARAAYVVMEPAAWLTLVPLAFASLVTGIMQSLGTQWGLVQHYWVVFKLLITVVATVVLLTYTQTLSFMAEVASASADLREVQNPSPALHAGAALLLLLATTLAVYKPRGRTPWGRSPDLR